MIVDVLDVRTLPPVKRHEKLTEAFRNLSAGEKFEFINDHDPKPLYHHFCALFGNVVEWEYLKKEPEEWKIRVTRTGASTEQETGNHTHQCSSGPVAPANRVVKQFDVRSRPCSERHGMVFGSFNELNPGEAFIFINDHDPKPLYFKLKAEYDLPFEWKYLQEESGEWIIKVMKT